jgi:hypothetical protein
MEHVALFPASIPIVLLFLSAPVHLASQVTPPPPSAGVIHSAAAAAVILCKATTVLFQTEFPPNRTCLASC